MPSRSGFLLLLWLLATHGFAGVPPHILSHTSGDGGVESRGHIVVEVRWRSARKIHEIESISGSVAFLASIDHRGNIINAEGEKVGTARQRKKPKGQYPWKGSATLKLPASVLDHDGGITYSFRLIDEVGEESERKSGHVLVTNWTNDSTPVEIEKIDVNRLVRIVHSGGCEGYQGVLENQSGQESSISDAGTTTEQLTDALSSAIGSAVVGQISNTQIGKDNQWIGPIINTYVKNEGVDDESERELIVDQVADELKKINRSPEINYVKTHMKGNTATFEVDAIDDSCIAVVNIEVHKLDTQEKQVMEPGIFQVLKPKVSDRFGYLVVGKGEYRVTVTVMDNHGASDTSQSDVVVDFEVPVVQSFSIR